MVQRAQLVTSGRLAAVGLLSLLLVGAGCGGTPSGEGAGGGGGETPGCPLVCGLDEAVDAVACVCVAVCGGEACRVGERCTAGACGCDEGSCPEGSACSPVSHRCDAACTLGCGDGEVLDAVACACVARCTETSCAAGERCGADGSCVPVGCGAPCAEGESCTGGATASCACDPAADACPAGSACDPGSLHCAPIEGCDPACVPGFACAGSPPACVPGCSVAVCGGSERCDPRTGACIVDLCDGEPACAVDETCDPQLGTCVADLCFFASCAGGEGCEPLLGVCACDPRDDRCPAGKSCDPATLRCVLSDLPQEYEPCNPAQGCAPGLGCTTLGAQGSLCLSPCAESSQCPTLWDYCQADLGVCLPNSCGPGGQTQPGRPFYGSCDGVAPDSGYCLPVDDGSGGSLGLCVDGGTAPAGAPCADDASRNDLTQACPAGEFCFGTCTPICDPRLDGQCPIGTGCLELDPAPDPWGICTGFAPCAGVTCQDGLTCDQADGVCKDACGNGCGAFELCDASTGSCVPDGCGAGCGPAARCVNDACESYACWGVVCDGGSACDPLSGVCESGCPGPCEANSVCSGGQCVAQGDCANANCGAGEACDPRLAPVACVPQAGAGQPCDPVLGCVEGQACVEQDGGYGCRPACGATADCADPTTECAAGACVSSYCGPGTLAGGLLLGPCGGQGGAGGTCVPATRAGGEVGICHDAGTAETTCSVDAPRALPAELCVAGRICVASASGGRCHALCDPANGQECPAGESCSTRPDGASSCSGP